MATTTEEERAVELAQKASESVRTGKLPDAARYLREATTIAPEHPKVKDGWMALKQEEEKSLLISVCKDWVKSRDEADGEKALREVKGQSLSTKAAEDAMSILFSIKGEDDTLDHVTGELLGNLGAQRWLAKEFEQRPTQMYYELFERGDDSIDGLFRVLLNRPTWPSDKAFVQGHRDAFMLSLAMMMEEALDHPERAMKGIATLLAAYAKNLHGIIDADGFDVILTSLDIRLPSSLRSQATLATVKLLELAPESAQKLIAQYVTSRVQRATADDLIHAFSAAATMFPITTSAAAKLFLVDGFVSTLVPLVESKKSTRLDQATLELLSAACVDKTCREAVNRHCRQWLEDMVSEANDKKRANLAALILVKLGEEPAPSDGPQIVVPGKLDQDGLIERFKSMILSSEKVNKQDSVEGLAFASLQPKVREDIANTPYLLKRLIETMKDPEAPAPVLFGGLSAFVNITSYLPIQSEEEKRMSQLKAYANTQKPSAPDPLEDEAHVTARCRRTLDAGIVPFLVTTSKTASPTILSKILQILLSLSKAKNHRGTMAQQGAVKLLINTWDHISSIQDSSSPNSAFSPAVHASATQALARILISINPSHVFSTAAAIPSASAIRPLLSLLTPNDNSTWALHAFESLLALTNLASMDIETQNHIIRTSFDTIADDLMFSSNKMLRRAATELTCNLMASPLCVEKFADGSPRSRHRLHVLLAMTDVDDASTRSAAGGALAMLLGYDVSVEQLLKQERGVDYLLGLCKDGDEGIRHRGVVCVRSVVGAEGKIGKEGLDIVKQKGGVEVLKQVLKEGRSQEVLGMAVETLKILLGQS
ncbi:ARM repeat-containing protein [Lojkania enalia]|uniref:ARM repeat-containing protein n=1 Tax=Lojkania enalia TaxID=147567 RepID=A0A9P4KIC7_9PLEO|nr:ARM repeat-containing protein [Didymosphaeria enalia]